MSKRCAEVMLDTYHHPEKKSRTIYPASSPLSASCPPGILTILNTLYSDVQFMKTELVRDKEELNCQKQELSKQKNEIQVLKEQIRELETKKNRMVPDYFS